MNQQEVCARPNEPARWPHGGITARVGSHSMPAKAGAAPKTDETECPGSQFDAADRASRVIRLFDHNYQR